MADVGVEGVALGWGGGRGGREGWAGTPLHKRKGRKQNVEEEKQEKIDEIKR